MHRRTKGSRVAALVVAAAAATGSIAAQAADPLQPILERNAREQARLHDALANGRIDPLRAAQVQRKAAEVYQQQAEMLAANPGPDQQEQLRQAQRDLAGAIAWAEKNPARNKGNEMDRTRLAVASAREAEQQRLMARAYADGRLSAAQVATLQQVQAKVAAAQYEIAADGETTQQEAREIQGAQNVLDYSIRRDPAVAELVTLGTE